VDALGDQDDRVRASAAAALGRIGPAAEEAVPALIEALKDEAAGPQAEESLVKIGRAAVPALIQVVGSPDQSTRWHAANALTRISGGG
jgi:HEAT repeat protein